MEKKTMGSFMAALRKAQGMTQRELAERLNVSDKSISRWECDDGYPDVSMLPVIAEIFGITVDELLRGERKAEKPRQDGSLVAVNDKKSAKELKRLCNLQAASFRSRSILSAGIALLGALSAAVINLGFLRGPLGFYVGCVFILSSIILEAVSINNVLSRDYEEVNDGSLVNTVIHFGEVTFAIDAILLGFLLPLVVFVSDPYLGLTGGSWLCYGSLFAGVVVVLSLVIVHILNGHFVKKEVILLKENEKTLFWKNHRYNTWSGIALVVLLLFTILLHLSLTQMWGPLSVMKGSVFEDTESFVAFMETEVPEPRMVYGPAAPLYGEEEEYDVTYYDEYGNIVTKEEAWRKTLTDKNGKEILSYVQWNRNVLSISWVPKDGSVLPITVYTYDDYREAEHTVKERNLVFGFVYALEILLFAVGYGLLRRKTLR